MSRFLPILAVQAGPSSAGDALAVFERDLRRLHRKFPDTQLFIWPELHLTTSDAPETIPGPLTERLGRLAREVGVWLVPGSMFERGAGSAVHNTAVVFAPSGDMVASYRKLFPWRPREETAPGDTFEVFDMPGVGRVGLMICYDGWFPEVVRHLAWLGAELIIHPSATPTVDRAQELVLARANAIVNQVWVVNVNSAGPPGPGRSVIVDPEGNVVAEAGSGVEHLSHVIDLDAVARVRRFGTAGLNRMWDQLDREASALPLPMYGGHYVPRREPRLEQVQEVRDELQPQAAATA